MLDGTTEVRQRRAYTVTPDLLGELGYTPDMVEDAEYAALVLASIAGLAEFGERVVVVAEVDASLVEPGDDSPNGECLLTHCPPAAMTAWFADAPEVRVPKVPQKATIDEAWDLPQVQALLQEHDLLWNDVAEYRRRQ
ncbi:MAG: hypothetical protein GX596_02170 [Propionibacterium sp.]|nr:hypothetical protein [Propionibacterium sp.]